MSRFKWIPVILVVLLLVTACQPADTAVPDVAQDPTGISGPDLAGAGLQSFIDSLVAAGSEVSLDSEVEQPFFSPPGQVITVNGEAVQVFEYPDPDQAAVEAAQVAPDGSSIGTSIASWIGPPHFYRADQLIVLYVGDNRALIELLETVLGPQFAGAAPFEGPSIDTEPPAALLQVGTAEQTSGIGSFCWPDPNAGVGLCLDTLGIPTPSEPLQVTAPFAARLEIPVADPPDILSATAIPVTPEDQMPAEIEGLRMWPPQPGDRFDFPQAPPYELELSLDPGLYVLSVFVQWQDIGDVNYGFLVEVLAPQDPEISTGEDTVAAVVILAEAGLNLRTAPDTASEVVGILPQNEIVPVIGASPDSQWWQVACPEGTTGECWITADPRWSEPAALLDYSLAGLIYSQLDDQSERSLWLIGPDDTPTLFQENSQNLGALSPDGTQTIPWSPPRGETNLSLVDLATGETRQLTATADRYNFNPQWWEANPDTIIFVSKTFNPDDLPQPGPGNLAAVQIDGSGFVVLDDEHEMHTFQPALAPDGLRIAYNHGGETASEDGLFEPWVYHLEDGPTLFDYAAYGLSEYPGLSFGAAAWSPDGRYLAWVIGGELTGAGEWETGLAMFDLEGQRVELLTPYEPEGCIFVTCYEAPLWNPTGEWLAWYVTPAGGLPNFWVLRPDGTDAEFIDFAVGPVWSPAGDLLVYSQNTSFTTSVIMVMETGQWQPQRTGLPTQIGIFDWIRLSSSE